MSEDIAIGQRLRAVRDSQKLSQEGFSDELGISLRGYQNYERGERAISKELICSLIGTFNVDPIWLLTGKGSMYRQPADTSKTKALEEIDESLKQLSDEQRQEIFSTTIKMLKMNAMEKEIQEMKEVLKQLKLKAK